MKTSEELKTEIMDLHEPFPMFPVVFGTTDLGDCPYCGEDIDETWGDLHDEDSEGSQYTLCLAKGPEYLVCRECSNGDEVEYPCNTLRIFGVEE